jgi:hypothetical protein
LGETAKNLLAGKAEKKGKGKAAVSDSPDNELSNEQLSIKVVLQFKRYIYDGRKQMIQS